MTKILLTPDDIEQIRRMGLTPDQVFNQIEIFLKGTPYLNLDRPCVVGDGIIQLTPDSLKKNISLYEKEAAERDLIKFVPASGAASRMVKTLIKAVKSGAQIRNKDLETGLLSDKKENNDLLKFISNMDRFACCWDLKSSMKNRGLDFDAAMRQGDFKDVLETLVTEKGLDYARMPKGLIKFHAYPEGARTAFEEHLAEAAGYAMGKDRRCRLHFTVSEAHMDRFQTLFDQVRAQYESLYDVTYEISFSIQEKETDTIAVDMENKPFKGKDGRLLFRPGGHGALIQNLNRISGDVVFIKNIDNVAHDRFKVEMFAWKKALAGCLISLQQEMFYYLKQLHQEPVNIELIHGAADFIRNSLYQNLPADFNIMDVKQQRETLIQRLDRPIRVCGMVQNVGEPGGGPFWVREKNGEVSMQIVETSQIDMDNERQKSIFNALTHFNPVDIICGLRDWKGEPFDLLKYVDSGAVFISQKSEDGRDLKALEHPGLWNGAMAYWNTIFVEVPLITFNPVKQITDLLRDAHMS
jgi:hypothetical protein